MAVPGDRCERCQFCGNESTDELEIFCPIAKKDPSENVCWCVCSECKLHFLSEIGDDSV